MNIVIMAGGSGIRLWPMSRKKSPKQLQSLISDRSLLQETFDRIHNFVSTKNIFVSTSQDHVAEIRRHLPEIPKENYIIEPCARNNAPAAGLIAAFFYNRDPQSIITAISSDHIVRNIDVFQESVINSYKTILDNPEYVMTIGIKPTEPHTGLGYIKMGEFFTTTDKTKVFKVDQFVEKPDLPTAKKYLKSGKYFWNSSYFSWRADTMLNLFKNLAPEYHKPLEKIKSLLKKAGGQSAIAKEYNKLPIAPIDTVIIEKAKKVLLIPADLGWSDVGSWASLHDILSSSTGHHIVSKGHHVGINDQNCLIFAREKLVATLGLQDVIVVDTPDVLLICNKGHSQDIKKIVDKLKEEGKHLYL